jgi:hypothetical protein
MVKLSPTPGISRLFCVGIVGNMEWSLGKAQQTGSP